MLHNFRDGLIAVLAGNAIYFVLMPYLPVRLQHEPYKQDLGLVLISRFVLFYSCWSAGGCGRKAARDFGKSDPSFAYTSAEILRGGCVRAALMWACSFSCANGRPPVTMLPLS